MEAKELNGVSKGKQCQNGTDGRYFRKAAQNCGDMA